MWQQSKDLARAFKRGLAVYRRVPRFHCNLCSLSQYGWVRIQMQKGNNPDQNFRLLDYAYGDVGDRIKAGQKSDQPYDLELESLRGLALGAAGLLAWRKRRSKMAVI